MCSINGFNFGDEELIRAMVSATKHRGPDDEGFYVDNNVSLGHGRLSIIDLSPKGKQPLWNEDKTICVLCNGEIYNFKELREELESQGHKFFSGSDSEVIVHLYEEHGSKTPQFLNGIFAFVIYDKKNKELFLVRDRQGVKPLYYYFDGQTIIFSSEIKGILAHPIKRELNSEAFEHHFRLFFTPAPFTLLNSVYKLESAHYLLIKDGQIKIERYWDLIDRDELTDKNQAKEQILGLLKDSVKRQLISDRPVGIFLSGGIDSSAVLGIASEFIKGKIKTFSIGFKMDVKDEKFNQDFYLAKKTAQHYETDHHQLLVSDKEAAEVMEKVVWHMEEPAPNPTQIPTFLLAKEAKKEVAVVLGGDGADEIFGGYPRYYYESLLNRYQKLPTSLKKSLGPALAEKVLGKKDLAEKLNTPAGASRYFLYLGGNLADLKRVFQPVLFDDLRHNTLLFLCQSYPENKFKDKLKYLMYLDLSAWLSDESLLRSDKMTMAHGLEERVPILDHRLIELAFQIPSKWKIKGKDDYKWIFKQAVEQYLPPHVLNQKKMGFVSPGAKWLRGGMESFAREVLSEGYCRETKDYFNFPAINQMLNDHIAGRAYHFHILWALLCFQIWHRQFISQLTPGLTQFA